MNENFYNNLGYNTRSFSQTGATDIEFITSEGSVFITREEMQDVAYNVDMMRLSFFKDGKYYCHPYQDSIRRLEAIWRIDILIKRKLEKKQNDRRRQE